MKMITPSALYVVAALLAVSAVTAFVPNSCEINHGHMLITHNDPVSTTACFAAEVDVQDGSASASTPAFPFSDRQVRYAYDEWRLIYGKGDFIRERFENFKLNHKTLTISNLKAREKAANEGRPIPQWMSLNEYGDYSLDEYEAMMQGENPRANDDQIMNYGVEAGEQLVRGTQPINGGNAMNNNYGEVQEYQDQFGRTIRSTQPLTSDMPLSPVDTNYANNIENDDASSRGTLIIPNGENAYPKTAPRGTQVIGTNNAARGTQVIGSASAPRGTQVIGSASVPRGTQVINSASSPRGTQVISSVSAPRGTQVISSASTPRGTQVVRPASGARPTQVIVPNGAAGTGTRYGTQVVNGAGPRGTQVLRSDGGQNNGSESSGTQVLQSSSSDPDEEMESESGVGTILIPKDDVGTQIIPNTDVGTQLISKSSDADDANSGNGEKDTLSKIFDGLFGNSKKEEDNANSNDVGQRGTMVIKRSFEDPEEKPLQNPFNFFSSGKTAEEKEEAEEIENEPEPAKSNNFFGFLSSGQNSTATETTAAVIEEEEETKKGSGIFSLFGGEPKVTGTQPVSQPAQVTKSAQTTKSVKVTKPQGSQSRRKTKLIPDETESVKSTPSMMSFFGGSKKVIEEDSAKAPNSRSTAAVEDNKKFQWSFSGKKTEKEESPPVASPKNSNTAIAAQIAKQREGIERAAQRRVELAQEREAKRQERENKRLAGKTDTTTPKPPATVSPFAFFGAIGRQADPPTLKNWRQNRDGTLTGLIFDSKNFKDGTRITTSPVPRGAKKGSVVETGGGSKYSLT